MLAEVLVNEWTKRNQQTLAPHKKYSWAKRLRNVLAFVAANRELALDVGAISCSDKAVLINPPRLTKVLGLANRNSLNRNLKQHGFELIHSANVADELRRCCPVAEPDVHHWSMREFKYGPFNPGSTDAEVAVASNYRRTQGSLPRRPPPVPAPAPDPAPLQVLSYVSHWPDDDSYEPLDDEI